MDLKKALKPLLFSWLLIPGFASAVTPGDFEVNTTKDLIDLCTTSSEDPKYQAAIHFCHGYLVGAYHYHAASKNTAESSQLVCFPKPMPSRNTAIAKVIFWAQEHPEYMTETPVETEFRALADIWPCKK